MLYLVTVLDFRLLFGSVLKHLAFMTPKVHSLFIACPCEVMATQSGNPLPLQKQQSLLLRLPISYLLSRRSELQCSAPGLVHPKLFLLALVPVVLFLFRFFWCHLCRLPIIGIPFCQSIGQED